ncbi:hypothetical protein KM043_008155 [Ampulex compressa]|nr:hypothetical protein KM043_008155 [Ampulex compressa]
MVAIPQKPSDEEGSTACKVAEERRRGERFQDDSRMKAEGGGEGGGGVPQRKWTWTTGSRVKGETVRSVRYNLLRLATEPAANPSYRPPFRPPFLRFAGSIRFIPAVPSAVTILPAALQMYEPYPVHHPFQRAVGPLTENCLLRANNESAGLRGHPCSRLLPLTRRRMPLGKEGPR